MDVRSATEFASLSDDINQTVDVLKGYMPYQTAYRLKEDIANDKLVDVRTAVRTIAKWQSHHPTNVMSKVEFIIEHFVKNVAGLLEGQAKAMIVTSSRASVIRYKYAIDAYLAVHPEYDKSKIAPNLQFKVPGEPLVAFSDKVKGENCIMSEDEEFISEFDYLKENPFAHIKRDYDYTEANMNNLGYQSVEKAFDAPDKRLLIVANKFQTGFNQPKLCAMYIDKRINNDIEIVQTYSRLNRTFPGKDTVYIIDFVNDPEIVLNAFLKYDKGAEMEHAQSLEIIYQLKEELDDAEIYSKDDCETYKIVRYKSIATIDESKKDKYRQQIYINYTDLNGLEVGTICELHWLKMIKRCSKKKLRLSKSFPFFKLETIYYTLVVMNSGSDIIPVWRYIRALESPASMARKFGIEHSDTTADLIKDQLEHGDM